MASAQIRNIRLLRAQAHHVPGLESGSTLRVDMNAVPQANLESRTELRVLIKYSAQARRSSKSVAEITLSATFELMYHLPDSAEPSRTGIAAFAHTNAMLNSFPYWREYVQSTVARMGLPPLVLPLFRIVPPPDKPVASAKNKGLVGHRRRPGTAPPR
jgi:preprotein translocase subunit SecB